MKLLLAMLLCVTSATAQVWTGKYTITAGAAVTDGEIIPEENMTALEGSVTLTASKFTMTGEGVTNSYRVKEYSAVKVGHKENDIGNKTLWGYAFETTQSYGTGRVGWALFKMQRGESREITYILIMMPRPNDAPDEFFEFLLDKR